MTWWGGVLKQAQSKLRNSSAFAKGGARLLNLFVAMTHGPADREGLGSSTSSLK